MSETLTQWIDRQRSFAATAMMRSISPLGLVKTRPGFGQTIRPLSGSIVASPVIGAYDPDPDYFFHWFRDGAIVVDALRLLFEEGLHASDALAQFEQFIRFNCRLWRLDGGALVADGTWRSGIAANFADFVRPDDELAKAKGDAIFAETRVNPDGTLDISRWGRPQNDGPALQALTILRWLRSGARFASDVEDVLPDLLQSHIGFVMNQWREPCFDIWEEDFGHHYYTLRVQAAALEEAVGWFDGRGRADMSEACRAEAAAILATLDGYWLADDGVYRSRRLASGEASSKNRDMSVVLAVLHSEAHGACHSVADERMRSTLSALESMFGEDYAINRDRPAGQGPAMGRYRGDHYFSGGAWYLATLGAAEFYFRASVAEANAAHAQALVERGDCFIETVRAFTPESGAMSEQFDQTDGEQTSAKHLAWSYAAFISCAGARRRALACV